MQPLDCVSAKTLSALGALFWLDEIVQGYYSQSEIETSGTNNYIRYQPRRGFSVKKIIAESSEASRRSGRVWSAAARPKPTSRAAVLGKPEAAALCVGCGSETVGLSWRFSQQKK